MLGRLSRDFRNHRTRQTSIRRLGHYQAFSWVELAPQARSCCKPVCCSCLLPRIPTQSPSHLRHAIPRRARPELALIPQIPRARDASIHRTPPIAPTPPSPARGTTPHTNVHKSTRLFITLDGHEPPIRIHVSTSTTHTSTAHDLCFPLVTAQDSPGPDSSGYPCIIAFEKSFSVLKRRFRFLIGFVMNGMGKKCIVWQWLRPDCL